MADVAGAVDTIVLVMLENRSFDHLLGWMSLPPYGNRTDIEGLKGRIDSTTRELTNPAYRNRARNQVWRPYMAEKDVCLASDLPHGRNGVRMQMHYVLPGRSEEHTSELQSPCNLVCRLLLEKKK